MVSFQFHIKPYSIHFKNKGKYFFIFILINTIWFMYGNSFLNQPSSSSGYVFANNQVSSFFKIQTSYTDLVSPITIIGNAGFLSCNCTSQGNGMQDSPYLIENFFINNQPYGIQIVNTTTYFKILHVWINQTTDSTKGYGIGLFNVSNGELSNNTISYTQISYGGIYINHSKNILIDNNHFSNQNVGSDVEFSSNIIIQNNDATNDTGGFYDYESINNTYYNNIGRYNVDGMEIKLSNSTLISYNIFTDNSGSGIWTYGLINVTFSLNELSYNNIGLQLGDSNNNTLLNNIASNNSIGVLVANVDGGKNSTGNLITNNTLSKNTDGIYFGTGSDNNFIISNIIINNDDNGIDIVGSNNNTFLNNEIFANSFGINISLDGSIPFLFYSSFNKIIGNKINNNIHQSVYLSASANFTQVLSNEFINNNNETSQAADQGFNNSFSHNFWSDWTKPDNNSDGIVDNPYPINLTINSYDYFPLTVDIYSPYIIIETPSNQTIEFGEFYHNITWNILSNSQGNYIFVINGTVIGNGSWSLNQELTFNISQLPISLYNFTLIVTDANNETTISTVYILIHDTIAPIILSPYFFSFKAGTDSNILSWQVFDSSPGNYSIYQDSLLMKNDTWNNEPLISINLDYLGFGIYNFTLVLQDTSGNIANDSVQVTVFNPVVTLTTTISYSTSVSNSGGSSLDPLLILGGAVGLGLVSIGGVTILYRRK